MTEERCFTELTPVVNFISILRVQLTTVANEEIYGSMHAVATLPYLATAVNYNHKMFIKCVPGLRLTWRSWL